jgi:hypothetical protein
MFMLLSRNSGGITTSTRALHWATHEILAVTLDTRELDELNGLAQPQTTTTLGPGLLYEVARSPEDPLVAWYVFRIWQSLTLALSRALTTNSDVRLKRDATGAARQIISELRR